MSGIDTKSLLAQALFRADPRSQECRDMIQQTMVEIALLNSDSPISEKQICDKISDMLEQPSISKEECNKAIQKCLERDLIKKKHEGYILKKEQKETLIKQREGCIEDEKYFDDELIQSVEHELGATLDEIAKTLLCSSVKTVIQRIFHEKSVELKRLISEGKCDYKSLLKAGSKYDPKDALKNELRPMISLYALNKQVEVIGGVKSFLASMNEAATRYLISLHHRVFYFQLLNIDPGLIELQKKCFENTRLYLDTNVVIALLFEAHPLHAVVRDVLNASKTLSINLFVSPSTFGELTKKVSQSISMITIIGEQKAASLMTETLEGRGGEPIIATYLLKKRQEANLSWGGFIGPYEDMETYLLHCGIILEDEGHKDIKIHEHYNRVWQTIRSVRRTYISDYIVDHDTDNFILIHMLRHKYPDNPLLGPSVWLLTLDHSLKTDEEKLASIFKVEHSRLIDEWGKLLLPFQNIRLFVFSNYLTYLVASELGALIQIPALDFSILKIVCNPELSLTDFFDLPVELQVSVLTGMQKDKNIRELQERANKATTPEEKTKIADEFRSKELELLVEEKKHIEEQASQLSKEINQLRDELGKVTSISGEKEKTVRDLTSRVKMAEERLKNYESMSFWDWFKKFFQRK